jgi:hypothetical protein
LEKLRESKKSKKLKESKKFKKLKEFNEFNELKKARFPTEWLCNFVNSSNS